jgi:hypothetical protein
MALSFIQGRPLLMLSFFKALKGNSFAPLLLPVTRSHMCPETAAVFAHPEPHESVR